MQERSILDGHLIDREPGSTIPDLVARAFDRFSDRTAVLVDGRSITFSELGRDVRQAAARLRTEFDVGPERIVAIELERSYEALVAILATWYAGGCYAAIDPDLPEDRRRAFLQALDPIVTIGTALDAPRRPDVVTVDRLRSSSVDATFPPASPSETDASYALFTSGSTGVPKAVVNEHRGLANRIAWMGDHLGLTTDDVVIHKTPLTFDVSVWEFAWPLAHGAPVAIVPPGVHRDPRRVAEVMRVNRVSIAHFVPPMLDQFLDHVAISGLSDLRVVICSGDVLRATLRDRFLAATNAALWNLYGPTEAAIDVTAHRCVLGDPPDDVPIGAPIWNTRIEIVDETLTPTPLGTPGEILIVGEGVARGYRGGAPTDADRFLLRHEKGWPYSTAYRTGDDGYVEAGEIRYIGRRDGQVKINGQRIELSEVELAISTVAEIRTAAVIAREEAGHRRLIAYYSVEPGVTIEPRQVRDEVALVLPRSWLPTAFVQIDGWPTTVHGKLDRARLPDPHQIRSLETPFVSPAGDLEVQIAAQWSRLLNIRPIGADDDFFELGGDSLEAANAAMELGDWLSGEFGIEEPPAMILFEHPSVRSLAKYVASLVPELARAP